MVGLIESTLQKFEKKPTRYVLSIDSMKRMYLEKKMNRIKCLKGFRLDDIWKNTCRWNRKEITKSNIKNLYYSNYYIGDRFLMLCFSRIYNNFGIEWEKSHVICDGTILSTNVMNFTYCII